MDFCDKCGGLIVAEKDGNKIKCICQKCGRTFRSKKGVSTSISEKIEENDEKILVIKEGEDFEQFPKTKKICPECEHSEAYWYMQQTRSGDEPPTRFYRCVKCGHSWREY